jgi:hypothetical protein
MKRDATIRTGLDAPIASVAFSFINDQDAVSFRLSQSFFWTSPYAWSIFAESTSHGSIEQGSQVNDPYS